MLKQLAVKEFDNFVDHRAVVNEDADPMLTKSLVGLTGHKWRGLHLKTISLTSSVIKLTFQICVQL